LIKRCLNPTSFHTHFDYLCTRLGFVWLYMSIHRLVHCYWSPGVKLVGLGQEGSVCCPGVNEG